MGIVIYFVLMRSLIVPCNRLGSRPLNVVKWKITLHIFTPTDASELTALNTLQTITKCNILRKLQNLKFITVAISLLNLYYYWESVRLSARMETFRCFWTIESTETGLSTATPSQWTLFWRRRLLNLKSLTKCSGAAVEGCEIRTCDIDDSRAWVLSGC